MTPTCATLSKIWIVEPLDEKKILEKLMSVIQKSLVYSRPVLQSGALYFAKKRKCEAQLEKLSVGSCTLEMSVCGVQLYTIKNVSSQSF